jgi:hypothetical protein
MVLRVVQFCTGNVSSPAKVGRVPVCTAWW